jgi:sulfur-carrier protein
MTVVTVRIPLPMRKLTHDSGSVEAEGDTVAELIADLERRFPGIRAKMLDDDGRLHRYMNIYIGGEDIRYRQGLDTPVQPDDIVQVIPAAAGGSAQSA